MISEDVSDHIVRCFKNIHRRNRVEISLHIFTDTPVEEEYVKKAFREHWIQEISNIKQNARIEIRREVCLAVLGIALLTAWFILSYTYDNVWMEVLSIMGWVAVWEASSVAFMKLPELRILQKIFDQASKGEVRISVVGDGQNQ